MSLIAKTFYSECSRAAATLLYLSLSSVLLNAISPAGRAGRYVCISTSLAGWLAGRDLTAYVLYGQISMAGRARLDPGTSRLA